MAPELLAGATKSETCDVWGIGLICYYILTGKQLFKGLSHPIDYKTAIDF